MLNNTVLGILPLILSSRTSHRKWTIFAKSLKLGCHVALTTLDSLQFHHMIQPILII